MSKNKKQIPNVSHLSQLLNQLQDSIIRTDPDFRITYWNKGAEQMYGYSETEALGKTTKELLRPIYAPGEREKIIDELTRLGTSKATIRTKHLNGTEIFAAVYSTRINDESGNVSGYVVTYRDVTAYVRANRALKEAEFKYRTVADNTHDFEFWIDPKGNYLYTSPACKRITGYDSKDFLSDSFLPQKIVHPDDKKIFLNHISYEFSKKKPGELEFRIIHKDDSVRWIHHICQPIQDENGKFLGVRGSNRDITERKKAEEQLQETRDYLENLLNYANAPIIVWDKDFKIIRFNHAFEHLTGYTSKTMIGKKLDILFPAESKEESLQKIQRTLAGEYWESVEIPILQKNGRTCIALWNSANVYERSGKKLLATIAQGQDITERKHIEYMFKESEIRLNRAQELFHLGSWELDLVNNHLIWSDEVYRIFGLKPQEFNATYEAFLRSIHPEDRTAVDTAYSKSLREGRDTYEIEHRVVRKNGDVRFVYEKCEHIRDNSGKVIRSVGMVQDITERKRAEVELVRLASFPLKNPNPIIEIDLSGKLQYLNLASKQFFPDLEKKGANHQFLKGIKNLIPEIQKKTTIVREAQIDDKYFLQTINYIPENRRIRIYTAEITLRKKAEEVLQESEEKYRRIVENTTNVIMVTQPDGIISYLSPSSKDILGYPPEELIGKNPTIFHPDDIKKVQQALSGALKGEKGSNLEYRIITKNGKMK